MEQSIKENLDRAGFKYASSAPVTMKAKITGPTTEAISYHFAGSFVVNQYNSSLSIQYQGKPLWSQRATNVPGAVSGRDKEDIKKQLEKAGRRPKIKFFSSTQLPDYLQKPTEGGTNQQAGQMLGSSKIDRNGIVKE